MSADLTVPPPMPQARIYGNEGYVGGPRWFAADQIRERDAIWSSRIASLLRAVPPLPVVAYLRATKDREPVWDEDCVCQDPVYPADPDGSDAECISMAMVRKADADAAIASLQAENAKLRTVMIAAAETIHAHWDAHCDAEGYGPANLMRRLEEGIPAEYGYTAGAFASLQARLEAAERDAKRYRWLRSLKHCNEAWCFIGAGEAEGNLDAAIDAATSQEGK